MNTTGSCELNPIIYTVHYGEQDKRLSFVDVLTTLTEQGFRSSVYPKFTKQYLNFNSRHPYNVKNEIIHCLQHQAKAISSDSNVYQEEMKSLRDNYHHNYPENITLAPRNLD